MTKTAAVNTTAQGAWFYGNAAGDTFAKEDVQKLGANFDLHNHSDATHGLPIPYAGISAVAFTTWTPTISQPGALATSIQTGFYVQIGKLVVASLNLTANAAGTATNDIVIGGIPVAAQGRGAAGFGYYQKTSGGQVWTVTGGTWPTSTTLKLAASVAAGTFFGTQPAVTVAIGDTLTMTLVYEAA